MNNAREYGDSFDSYVPSLRDRGLTIFMPFVHHARTIGMAKTFRDRGHRLMMSDPSSFASIHGDHHVSPEVAREHYGSNVSSYVGNEIYDNPPDIIVVGSHAVERDCIALRDRLIRKKPVTLVAMSGNVQSHFEFARYDGAICCDLPTRLMARCNGVPAIRYVEATWLDDYPARPMPRDAGFVLRSFINHFVGRWPLTDAFHAECVRVIRDAFGEAVGVENVEWRPKDEVRQLLIATPMLLHIKDSEGFGWSVLEALFTGRPIIYQAGMGKDMTFLDWLETGVSGFPIQQPADVLPIIDRFRNDRDALDAVHRRTAEIVRVRYDGPERAEDMVQFISDLHRVTRARWIPDRNGHPPRVPAYHAANLDPAYEQDFVRVWRECTTTRD